MKALTTVPNKRVIYSITIGGKFAFLPNANEGLVKLSQNIDRVTVLRTDNTRRTTITIKAVLQDDFTKSAQVTVNLIALRFNFGDKYVSTVLNNINNLVKPDNIFRATTVKYPMFKKFHRVLMQATPRCKAISSAGVTFLRVKTEITKRILQEFAGKNLLTEQCIFGCFINRNYMC